MDANEFEWERVEGRIGTGYARSKVRAGMFQPDPAAVVLSAGFGFLSSSPDSG